MPELKFGKNMCGRYSAAGNLSELAKLIDFICRAPFFAPRYNIAPRQQAPVIILENFQPVLKLMRWGLIPSWAKDEKFGDGMINARAETISEKTSFKKPFHRQRCLIPADGFFEWQHGKRDLTPFRFTMRDNSFFVLREFLKNGFALQNPGNLFLTPIWTRRRRHRESRHFRLLQQRQTKWSARFTSGCR